MVDFETLAKHRANNYSSVVQMSFTKSYKEKLK